MDDDCEIDYKDGGFEDVIGDDGATNSYTNIVRQFHAKKRRAKATTRGRGGRGRGRGREGKSNASSNVSQSESGPEARKLGDMLDEPDDFDENTHDGD